MIGGAIGGFVFEHVGPPQLFLGSAGGIAVGTAMVWVSAGRRDRAGH
jgi:predicted MFS family arabinose efflux permease